MTTTDTTTYSSRDAAVEAIATAIEAGGAASRVEFDLDAIVAETHADYSRGYRQVVGADDFWQAVQRHAH